MMSEESSSSYLSGLSYYCFCCGCMASRTTPGPIEGHQNNADCVVSISHYEYIAYRRCLVRSLKTSSWAFWKGKQKENPPLGEN